MCLEYQGFVLRRVSALWNEYPERIELLLLVLGSYESVLSIVNIINVGKKEVWYTSEATF